jgi:membrane protease YdiL (CAAX protease family)
MPISHPLVNFAVYQGVAGKVLFVVAVCGFGPLGEEFLYRGLILPWVGRRLWRPWIVFVISLALTSLSLEFGTHQYWSAVVFVVLLGGVQFLLQRIKKWGWTRFPRRTVLAIWSSSMLFAVAHVNVWPSPIALFVLALGFGYLTVRLGSFYPAVLSHMLFNAVSTLVVLW